MRYLRFMAGPVLALAFAFVVVLSSGDTNAWFIPGFPQFQPDFDFKLCNDLPDTFSGPPALQGPPGDCTPTTATAGAVTDITSDFNLPQGHMNYDQAYFVTVGGASETRVAGPVWGGPNPDGTGLPGGGLMSTITLSLLTNPCDYGIQPDFIWWDAETDITDTVACQPEGTANRWLNMAAVPDDGDIYYGQADADSPIVTSIPDCSLKLFDPDGSGDATGGYSPVQPNWRGAGLTQVPPGGSWQMLQNYEFAPGALQAAFLANPNTTRHPFAKLDASLGYVNAIVLNDPTTVILEPNTISDFCSSLGTQGMIKGQIGAVNRITQPATPGSYMVQARTQSLRDADGDGLENKFDTCAWTPNIDDPYVTPGTDFDMMDPACDQDPGDPGTANPDEDADGYLNNQDYCPKIYNPIPGGPGPGPYPGETDAESAQPYNTAAPDGGPRQDQIGDDCDSEQGGNDLVSNGLYFNAIHVDSVCIEGGGVVDNDNDGWCDDLDPDDADANDPRQMTHLPMDSAGIVFPPSLDSDGDGVSNLDEWNNYPQFKYPGIRCSLFPGMDPWPADFDQNKVINILDVNNTLPPAFGRTSASPSWVPRIDLIPDGVINILDVNMTLPPQFGKTCAPPPPCPTANQALADAEVAAGIADAWTRSDWGGHEEGGWIVQNTFLGFLAVDPWPAGTEYEIEPSKPNLGENKRVCGEFHTHPLFEVVPSDEDIKAKEEKHFGFIRWGPEIGNTTPY